MIKFLKLSRRGPRPGLRGTADGYSPDIARTGTLKLRLRLCHKYNILKSNNQTYLMSTNVEQAEKTIAKLPVKASAWNLCCLKPMLYDPLKNLNPWIPGCAEVQSQSFWPVEGSRLNLCDMNLR